MLYRKYKLLPGLWNVYWYIITDLDILLFFSVKNTYILKETIINVILQTNNFFMNGVKVLSPYLTMIINLTKQIHKQNLSIFG